MDDTGRLRAPLLPGARRIAMGSLERALAEELPAILRVDRAHVVMLAEHGALAASAAARLLGEIDALEASDLAPLRGAQAPRGAYLAYEDLLIRRLGTAVGGAGHLGRSRNDLGATVLRMRLRRPFARTTMALLRLLATLLRAAERHGDTVLPLHTHFQPALPVTLGHYLAGVATALTRDLEGWLDAGRDLQRSPLGAAAGGGTSVPVDTARTACLLGFDVPAENSIDAVASRDVVLRLLAAAAVAGVTLSRAAGDLLLWSTPEFGFIWLPDPVSGSSSHMPQKRNPFLLEHVQGRGAAALGAFTAAATAMHAKPFTNSVAVGTEAIRPMWQALDDTADAAHLLRLVVSHLQPRAGAMERSAELGHTTAAALAERLALGGHASFREAHHRVGRLVTDAVERGIPLDRATREAPDLAGLDEGLTPGAVARANRFGGGPGTGSLERQLDALQARRRRCGDQLHELRARWRSARAWLHHASAAVRASDACSSHHPHNGGVP